MIDVIALAALALGEWQSSQENGGLIKETISKAVASQEGLEGLAISLWYYSGQKSEGRLTTISGDGRVVRVSTPTYPVAPGEKTITESLRLPLERREVERLALLFADDDLLKIKEARPAGQPEEGFPRPMRYAIELSLQGKCLFSSDCAGGDLTKRKELSPLNSLIQSIHQSVNDLVRKTEQQDAEFLSDKRINDLLEDKSAVVFLELQDFAGLYGGMAVRMDSEGHVQGTLVRPPEALDRGMQVKHIRGSVGSERAVAIIRMCTTAGTFGLVKKRTKGPPDEGEPRLTVRILIKGVAYFRSISLFEAEASETPAFQAPREALRSIGKELDPKK